MMNSGAECYCDDSYVHTVQAEKLAWPRWTGKPMVAGSIPTEARLIFQPTRCGYILRVTSQ